MLTILYFSVRSGYPSDWDERRRRVYERDDYECQRCGRLGGPRGGPEDDAELHAHHIVPKSEGGTDDISNLETLCHSCHSEIHGFNIGQQHVDRSYTSLIEKSRKSTSISSRPAGSMDTTNQTENPSNEAKKSTESFRESGTTSNTSSQDASANRTSSARTDPIKIECKICREKINTKQTRVLRIGPDYFPESIETKIDTFYVCDPCFVSTISQIAVEDDDTEDTEGIQARDISVLLLILLAMGIGWYFLSVWAAVYHLMSILLLVTFTGYLARLLRFTNGWLQ